MPRDSAAAGTLQPPLHHASCRCSAMLHQAIQTHRDTLPILHTAELLQGPNHILYRLKYILLTFVVWCGVAERGNVEASALASLNAHHAGALLNSGAAIFACKHDNHADNI